MDEKEQKKQKIDYQFRYKKSLYFLYRKQKSKIDALGYEAFSAELSASRRLCAYNDLAELLYRPLMSRQDETEETGEKEKKPKYYLSEQDKEEIMEGMNSFFVDDVPRYNPAIRGFYSYMLDEVPRNLIDLYKEYHKHQEVSLYEAVEEETANDKTSQIEWEDILSQEEKNDEYRIVSVEAIVIQMLAALLNVHQNLKGKKSNPARINYFRLFFTDKVVYSLRHIDGMRAACSMHEREIMRQLKPLFLKYVLCLSFPDPPMGRGFMPLTDNYCSIMSILSAPSKKREPFRDKVLIDYLETQEGFHSSPSLLSPQRKEFIAYLKQCGVGSID